MTENPKPFDHSNIRPVNHSLVSREEIEASTIIAQRELARLLKENRRKLPWSDGLEEITRITI